MGGHRWTDTAQKIWLTAKLPGYREAQVKSRVARYLTETYEDWFSQWSERDLLFLDLAEDHVLDASQTETLQAAIVARKEVSTKYFFRAC